MRSYDLGLVRICGYFMLMIRNKDAICRDLYFGFLQQSQFFPEILPQP